MKSDSVLLGDILTAAEPGFASGENVADGVIQVRMHNVAPDGTLDWSSLRRVPADDRKRRKYALAPGDIVFNSTNSPELVGKSALFSGLREPVLFSNHFLRLRVDRSRAEPGYIAWWLHRRWREREFERLATRWVNQAAVRKEDLLALELDLPSVDHQQRAAALLEKADRLRRERRYATFLAGSLLLPAFVGLFGSDPDGSSLVKVEDLAADIPNAIRTGPFGSQLLHSEFTSDGVPVLGIDNAVNNRFVWAKRRFISPAKYQQLMRYTVRPGDVLITIMATCGRCAVVPEGVGPAINTKHLCCITLDQSRCLPVFLHGAFLYHPFLQRQLRAATKGAIMDGLNMQIIRELAIPLPDLPAQEKWAKLAAAQERLRIVEDEALRQAEHLFGSLLERAFRTDLPVALGR